MKKSYIYIVVLILISVLVFTGCSSSDTGEPAEESEVPERTFTLEELSEYNGKDGMDAYVAVDGVVYDVTELDAWPDGNHNGNEAGNDLTKEITEDSPHGLSVLERAPVVGTLEE